MPGRHCRWLVCWWWHQQPLRQTSHSRRSGSYVGTTGVSVTLVSPGGQKEGGCKTESAGQAGNEGRPYRE